jgi:hypothetical protein
MTTYKGINGFAVQSVASDPSPLDEGQVWYNNASYAFKIAAATTAGAWASGGNLNTARYSMGPGGAGTQTAALVFGGYQGGNLTASESYNGSAWTTTPSLSTARQVGVNFGATNTAAICASGETPPGALTTQTESWNGSSWTISPATIANVVIAGNGIGSQTAGLSVGGQTFPGAQNPATESFNGTSWTALPATLNTGRNSGGAGGTQTAALLFGGDGPPVLTATESYNGTSWTTVNSLNTAKRGGFAAGNQTSALLAGGFTTTNVTSTETWNGTSWAASPANMATARRGGGYTTNSPANLGLAAGGYDGTTGVANTEEWTGPGVATTKTITTS